MPNETAAAIPCEKCPTNVHLEGGAVCHDAYAEECRECHGTGIARCDAHPEAEAVTLEDGLPLCAVCRDENRRERAEWAAEAARERIQADLDRALNFIKPAPLRLAVRK